MRMQTKQNHSNKFITVLFNNKSVYLIAGEGSEPRVSSMWDSLHETVQEAAARSQVRGPQIGMIEAIRTIWANARVGEVPSTGPQKATHTRQPRLSRKEVDEGTQTIREPRAQPSAAMLMQTAGSASQIKTLGSTALRTRTRNSIGGCTRTSHYYITRRLPAVTEVRPAGEKREKQTVVG